jgi:hypothetical protein
MSEMKLIIVHDKNGHIVAISKVVDPKQVGSKFVEVGLIPGKGQRMLEVELTGESDEMPLREIYRLYRVDHARSKLVKSKEPREMPPVRR